MAKTKETTIIDKSRGSIYSWVKNVPTSDGNFKSNLEKADAETLRAVLVDLPTENTSAKRKILEARLRRLKKNAVAIETSKTSSPNTVVEINLSEIVPSPFEPQARRRAKFKDADIDSLGASIENHGLAQPILVRPIENGKFEIVFGERRFLASVRKSLVTIESFVRKLTDAQVLELQYEENHRRINNDPLDDAFFFKFLKEKEGYTDEQLADRLNTSRKNVTDKLKLNDLIPAAAAELNEGKLLLKHAIYLAKFSAPVQEEIVREQYAYKYQDRTEAAVSYAEFKEEVEENILRRLENSPFDKEDVRLHIKGLICRDCPERTGFSPMLFTDLSRGDSCLNKSCFEVKTNTHLRLQRDAIAEARPNPTNVPLDEIARDVPLVTNRKYTQDERTPFREKLLTNQKFLEKPECEHSVSSLIVEGARKGEQTYICKSADCETHNPKPVLDESELRQKEAEFNRKVEYLTRRKILEKSLDFFSDYNPIWKFDDLVQKLIFELWNSAGSEVLRNIFLIIKKWKNFPSDPYNPSEVQNFIASFDKARQSQLIFLLIFQSEVFTNASLEGIKNLAVSYANTGYTILDAEARLELAPPEFKSVAAKHLEAVLTGVPAPVPRFWQPFDETPDDPPKNAIQAAELSQTVH